jgi:N-methylhydantoinase A
MEARDKTERFVMAATNVVGVDIGGTFTDLVGYVDGHVVTAKTSTIPSDPTKAIETSLALAGCAAPSVEEFLHGSTIAINTVLERKGARMALITTEGFRDIYAIGRSNRIEAFNLFFQRPEPLVPRHLTFEARERILASGEVHVPLDRSSIGEVVWQVLTSGVDAVAVSLIHAYANPDHERQIGAALRAAIPGLFVTLSHEILREYREYERTSTTVLNAFVGPRVSGYLGRLSSYLSGAEFPGKVHIMRSNGGVMSLELAREQPVSMMESGPVAGMIGAGELCRLLGIDRAVGFDMGGTTAKSSLLTNGAPTIETGYVIGEPATGQPMQLPVVDIVEVGAGGGSIAWVSATGGLHVGPQSVGADPGPACYGKGSPNPVVTDADLILGRINPQRFLNGGMPLDVCAARAAMVDKVAGPLGLGVEAAALGVTRIADAAMSLSVRAVSVNKGVDPRDCAMIAFGGAGPLHALAIAREISIPTVIIPKLPGTFSALGMLMAAWRQDFVQTLVGRVGDLGSVDVAGVFAELAAAGQQRLELDRVLAPSVTFAYQVDLRYVGQEHTLPIPVSGPDDLIRDISGVRERFDREHGKRYGQSAPNETIEIAAVRLVLTAPREDKVAQSWLSEPWVASGEAELAWRDVIFDDPAKPYRTQILWRPALAAGAQFTGPAVIEEPNSTTLIHPGDHVVVTEHGHLRITVAL